VFGKKQDKRMFAQDKIFRNRYLMHLSFTPLLTFAQISFTWLRSTGLDSLHVTKKKASLNKVKNHDKH